MFTKYPMYTILIPLILSAIVFILEAKFGDTYIVATLLEEMHAFHGVLCEVQGTEDTAWSGLCRVGFRGVSEHLPIKITIAASHTFWALDPGGDFHT